MVIQHEEEGHFDFRRLQVHEQQADRQRKNLLQKTMVFAARADVLQKQDQFYIGFNGKLQYMVMGQNWAPPESYFVYARQLLLLELIVTDIIIEV